MIKNTPQLLEEISQKIVDNNEELIAPVDVRTSLENIVESSVNKITDRALLGLQEYQESRSYLALDTCVYQGKLLQANKNTQGTFKAADWNVVADNVDTDFDGNRKVTRPGLPNIVAGGSNIVEFLNSYFFPFENPTASLNGFSLYEKGITVNNLAITGNINQNSATVATRTLRRGAATITTPTANSFSFIDPTPVTANTTYTLDVTFSNASPLSTSQMVQFVSPSYMGVGAAGLTQSGIKALNKTVWAKANRSGSFSPTLQRYYYCYPATFGNLTRILDPNGFDVTASFVRTQMTFTLLDGSIELMNVYVSNADTTQTNFNLSFQF